MYLACMQTAKLKNLYCPHCSLSGWLVYITANLCRVHAGAYVLAFLSARLSSCCKSWMKITHIIIACMCPHILCRVMRTYGMTYMYGRYNVSCVPIFSTHTAFSVLCTLAVILHEVTQLSHWRVHGYKTVHVTLLHATHNSSHNKVNVWLICN